eukprot:jgi/Mesvir1/11966/Mv26170-RA.1
MDEGMCNRKRQVRKQGGRSHTCVCWAVGARGEKEVGVEKPAGNIGGYVEHARVDAGPMQVLDLMKASRRLVEGFMDAPACAHAFLPTLSLHQATQERPAPSAHSHRPPS